jgi:hypothetical protein
MADHLTETLRKALRPFWDARLPDIVEAANGLEVGLSPSEAFQEGYRRAYWDALEDMANAKLLQNPDEVRIPLPVVPSDDVN